jgi:type IV secretory pathway VirB3-like protein
MGHQPGDGLGRHEADVQGRADRERPAEILGRVAVAAGTVVVMAVVVGVRMAGAMIVVIVVVMIVVGVVVRHGSTSHQERGGSIIAGVGPILLLQSRPAPIFCITLNLAAMIFSDTKKNVVAGWRRQVSGRMAR